MPLQLPNLDDRTYRDLVEEAISRISTDAPEWTNYNPSDPGITLIELFAHLTEMLIYRLNQVTSENKQAFLNLLSGLDENDKPRFPVQLDEPIDELTLNTNIQQAVLTLRRSDRAVTCDDIEQLSLQSDPSVARVRCVPQRNLEFSAEQPQPGHISVVILPVPSADRPNSLPEPSPELRNRVFQYLDERRLLTTQIHVVAPQYVPIALHLHIMLRPDVPELGITAQITAELAAFLSPSIWLFGRDVFVSELYALLDQLPYIDYVKPIAQQEELSVPNRFRDRLLRNATGQLIAVRLLPNELVNLQLEFSQLPIESPIRPLNL